MEKGPHVGIVEDVKCQHWKDERGVGMLGMCGIGQNAGWFPQCHNLLSLGACPLGKQREVVAEKMAPQPKRAPKEDLEPSANPPKIFWPVVGERAQLAEIKEPGVYPSASNQGKYKFYCGHQCGTAIRPGDTFVLVVDERGRGSRFCSMECMVLEMADYRNLSRNGFVKLAFKSWGQGLAAAMEDGTVDDYLGLKERLPAGLEEQARKELKKQGRAKKEAGTSREEAARAEATGLRGVWEPVERKRGRRR